MRKWLRKILGERDLLSHDAALARIAARGLPISTLIDVGAAQGDWTKRFRRYWPDTRCHLIDAKEHWRPALENYCARYPEKLSYVIKGVAASPGEARFSHGPNEYGGAIVSVERPGAAIESIATTSIEVTSGGALIWRLRADVDEARRERIEATSLRIVGVCFVVLALYVTYESVTALVFREPPEESIPGIILGVVSLIVMPLLARAKRRVADGISSAAMAADARQTDFCTYLSAILVGGLLLNALLGWWWADPVAGLVMVPIIAKEGRDALRGKQCGCSSCGCH